MTSIITFSNGDNDLSKLKCYKTISKEGIFKLYANSGDKICCLHILHHGYLPTQNLVRLANIHIATLPGIHESENLFAFFRQPKFLAVYHQDFHDLR